MSGQLLDMPIFEALGEGRHPWQVLTWPDGREYLTGASRCRGYLDYPGLGWTVLVRQPTEVAFAPARQAQTVILVSGLFMTVLAVLIAVTLARCVTAPLEGIAADARRLRDGELAEFPTHRGTVEIEVLSQSLREMVEGLARTRGERDSMERLAMIDNLTSLPNRAGFEGYVAQIESEGLRRNETLGILFMDLDGFKGVNDTLGHEAGDIVLREVAGRIRSVLRGHDRAVRLGGDEFVLIVSLERGSARPQAEGLTARLIEAVNKPMEVKGHRVQVGCSIGVAFYPESAAGLRQAVDMADAGLYAAKLAGKNQAAYS
jgi:diguanylate cyclase (GGDEF)-like protein